MVYIYHSAFAALLGLIFGSFISCVSWRWPRGENMFGKRSCCTICGEMLRARDLIPLFSWIVARGRCRHCGARVHWRYPTIEITTALLFAWVVSLYGISLIAAVLLIFTVMLMVMVVVDFEHYIIPDSVHIVLLPLGFAYHSLNGAPPMTSLIGGATGLLVALGLMYGYRFLRKREGLGLGDVKFFTVAGVWLGIEGLAPFFFIGGLLGVVTALIWRTLGKGAMFPFGPALAASLFLCVLYPQTTEIFMQGKMLLRYQQ